MNEFIINSLPTMVFATIWSPCSKLMWIVWRI